MSEKKSPVSTGILVSSILGAALLAIAGFSAMQPTGEQSKLVYDGKLWCVSNYLEQEPQEILKDGRPRQDKLLDDKQDWIVREQVSADSKAEAEKIARANGHGLFEPSDKVTMRASLTKNPPDKAFFTTHFNQGATIAGPCLGGGSSETVGMWLNSSINEKCGLNEVALDGNTKYKTVKRLQVQITNYSPCIPGNTCDCSRPGVYAPGDTMGGDWDTADGGTFVKLNGILQFKDPKGKISRYEFAQPSDDPVIPWSKRYEQGIVIDGFNNNEPVFIHDHYAPGNHAGQLFLDLFSQCKGSKTLSHPLAGIPNTNGLYNISIVDTTQAIVQAPKADPSNAPAKKLPDGTPCPTKSLTDGPSSGEDMQQQVAQSYAQQLSEASPDQEETNEPDTGSGEPYSGTYGEAQGLGKTVPPGGMGESPSFGTCHGLTPCHRSDREGHGVFQNRSGANGDAVDIDVPSNRAYASFDGTVTRMCSTSGVGFNCDGGILTGIRLTSTDGKVVAYYYHAKATKTGKVVAGEQIGTLIALNSGNHIHFELLVNGRSVHGDRSKIFSESSYQASLWKNMKTVLGI